MLGITNGYMGNVLVTAGNGHIRKMFIRKPLIQAIEPTLSSTHVQRADGLSCCLLYPSNNGERSGGSRISHGGGETNSRGGCANLLFCKMCAENCMNMKEFGRGGGERVPGTPVGSATGTAWKL